MKMMWVWRPFTEHTAFLSNPTAPTTAPTEHGLLGILPKTNQQKIGLLGGNWIKRLQKARHANAAKKTPQNPPLLLILTLGHLHRDTQLQACSRWHCSCSTWHPNGSGRGASRASHRSTQGPQVCKGMTFCEETKSKILTEERKKGKGTKRKKMIETNKMPK